MLLYLNLLTSICFMPLIEEQQQNKVCTDVTGNFNAATLAGFTGLIFYYS